MTPDQLALISRSAAAVAEQPRPFAEIFYGHLFTLAPEVRSLFPDNMEELFIKLVDELSFLGGAAGDLDSFVTRARDLGRRHHGYGVTVDHFGPVEEALLHALEVRLTAGEETAELWNPDQRLAWQTLYRLIAEVMLDGASAAMFS